MQSSNRGGDSEGVELQAPSSCFSPLPQGIVNESQPVTVILKEKIWSLSGDSFKILDTNQREVLQIKGKVFSFRQQKVLCDSNGHELGLILKKLLTFKPQEDIYTPDRSKKIASVSRKSLFQLKSNAVVQVLTTGEQINISGSFLARNFTFQLGDQTIAHVHRSLFNSRNLLAGKDSYLLTVAPNVDLAFMVLVTVCLDEIFNDKND
ncbi:hypothetical protein QOT17_008214 [Balamuthia mandrillaris]